MKRLTVVAIIICVLATLCFAGLDAQAQTVNISAKLKADQVEYFQAGWAFGSEPTGCSAWFYFSAFGEPGNDIIAVETPIVVLEATGTGVCVDIQSIKLELVITQNFYLTSEIACEGVIHL